MTMTIGKKILMGAHWLCSLLICLVFALYLIFPGFVTRIYEGMERGMGATGVRALGIVLLVIYIGLSVAQFCLIFRRKKRSERGFINIESTDTGKVRIAVSAIEQMVRQSVHGISGINNMTIEVQELDESINIVVKAAIVSGGHVPTITSGMQRSIRQFVETNCGVPVNSVLISIESISSSAPSTRKLRFGWGKGQEDATSTPGAQTYAPAPEPVVTTAPELPPEADKSGAEIAAEAPLEEPTASGFEGSDSEYDPDKPYESEFAKDLEAMRAREAAEAEASQDAGLELNDPEEQP